MSQLIATTGAYVSLGLLLFSGVSHLRHRGSVRALLRQQAIWPRSLEPAVVTALMGAELAVGVVGFSAITTWTKWIAVEKATLVGAAGLYAASAVYALLLVHRRPGAPCACSGRQDDPANLWTVIRAALLAVMAIVGWIGAEQVIVLPTPGSNAALSAIASVALAFTAWNLPAALQLPAHAIGGDQPVFREGT
jgi:hypothetical protein